MQTYGIDLDEVKIFPQGEYERKHKELEKQWKKSYRDFADKVRDDNAWILTSAKNP